MDTGTQKHSQSLHTVECFSTREKSLGKAGNRNRNHLNTQSYEWTFTGHADKILFRSMEITKNHVIIQSKHFCLLDWSVVFYLTWSSTGRCAITYFSNELFSNICLCGFFFLLFRSGVSELTFSTIAHKMFIWTFSLSLSLSRISRIQNIRNSMVHNTCWFVVCSCVSVSISIHRKLAE